MTNKPPVKLLEKDGWLCSDAPAKVNLFLHITGRRDDGYHTLESVFAFTKFGDKIMVRPSAKLSLEVRGEFAAGLQAEDTEDNLVLQAAQALRNYVGDESLGAEIVLQKNIPLAAGLGGGSSDAAATLRVLVALWGIDISDANLHAIALKLGADVPACLKPQTCFVSGIGEKIRRVEGLSQMGCVLVNSGETLVTGEVFSNYKDMGLAFTPELDGETGQVSLEQVLHGGNDLVTSAHLLAPTIAEVVETLASIEGVLLARMSGSGASCFALTSSIEEAQEVASRLKEQHASWWIMASEFIA